MNYSIQDIIEVFTLIQEVDLYFPLDTHDLYSEIEEDLY